MVALKGKAVDGGKGVVADVIYETSVECVRFRPPDTEETQTEGRPISASVSEVGGQVGAAVACEAEAAEHPRGPGRVPAHSHDPLLCRDDLRAYAYEGDGSSSGSSFTSTLSTLRTEAEQDAGTGILAPEFLEVIDLLKNLPDVSSAAAPSSRSRSLRLVRREAALPHSTDSSRTISSRTMVHVGGDLSLTHIVARSLPHSHSTSPSSPISQHRQESHTSASALKKSEVFTLP